MAGHEGGWRSTNVAPLVLYLIVIRWQAMKEGGGVQM